MTVDVESSAPAIKKTTEQRYRKFAQEFFIDFDIHRAYESAGYNAKAGNSRRAGIAQLLSNSNVQYFLQETFSKLQERLEVQQDRMMLEICRLSYSDLRGAITWGPDGIELKHSDDIADDIAAAIQSVKHTKKTRKINETVIEEEWDTHLKLHPKAPALKMLQDYFRRGDPLSADAEAKINALLMIMTQYVPAHRLEAFRAHIQAAFGIDIPAGTQFRDPEKPWGNADRAIDVSPGADGAGRVAEPSRNDSR